ISKKYIREKFQKVEQRFYLPREYEDCQKRSLKLKMKIMKQKRVSSKPNNQLKKILYQPIIKLN
ncbi:uncharacterized protein METZ01_LOCUS495956, partial [marine metagenome]